MPIIPPTPPSLTHGTVGILHKVVGHAVGPSAGQVKTNAKHRAFNLVKLLKAQYQQLNAQYPPTQIGDMGPHVFETGKTTMKQTGLALHVTVDYAIYVKAWWVRR